MPGTHAQHSPDVSINPFNAIRERLSAMDLAIQELQPQVQPHPYVFLENYESFKFSESFTLSFTRLLACVYTL